MPEHVYPNEYYPLKVVTLGGNTRTSPMLPLFKTFLELLFWPGLQSLQHILLILSSVMGRKSSSFEGGFDFGNSQKSFRAKTDKR